MFISNEAQKLIEDIRDYNNGGVNAYKASVSDAMSIIAIMHEVHATGWEKEALTDAMITLSSFNELLTKLSKEK